MCTNLLLFLFTFRLTLVSTFGRIFQTGSLDILPDPTFGMTPKSPGGLLPKPHLSFQWLSQVQPFTTGDYEKFIMASYDMCIKLCYNINSFFVNLTSFIFGGILHINMQKN